MKETRRITTVQDFEFDSEKTYSDQLTICEPMDSYLMWKEATSLLFGQIEQTIPRAYRKLVTVTVTEEPYDRVTIEWKCTPKEVPNDQDEISRYLSAGGC